MTISLSTSLHTTKHIKHCGAEKAVRRISLQTPILMQRLAVGMAFSSIALKAPVRNYIHRRLFYQAAFVHSSTRNVGRHCQCRPIHLLPSHDGPSDGSANPFDACWKASTQSVNPEGDPRIDDILNSLHSPAPQSYFVIQRALGLTNNEGSKGGGRVLDVDFVEKQLLACSYLLKPGRRFVLPVCMQPIDPLEPSCIWSAADPSNIPVGWRVIGTASHTSTSPSVMALAKQALELVLDASERQQPVEESAFREILDRLWTRLHLTLGTDLRGRTAAEAAFALSLAGARDESMYQALVHIACLELDRVGRRPSQRPKDVRHLVEKMAASGVRDDQPNVQRLYQLATECLTRHKGDSFTSLIESNRENPFDLLASPPSLWLWRYSSRLAKPLQTNDSLPHRNTSQHVKMQWNELFHSPALPLIIDVGCGMGTCLLGLASSDTPLFPSHESGDGISLSRCNFLGGDLSHATLRYASGIAHRWNLTERLAVVHGSSEDLIRAVLATYPGPVALVLVQFPTPYRLPNDKDRGGNSQLPDSPDEGFMVSEALMNGVATLLRQRSHRDSGYLLLQSNCEDVAITLRDRAVANGFQVVPVDRAVHTLPFPGADDSASRLTNRTVEWVHRGGERPIGPEWSAVPLLPPRCATETEVACTVQGTPVHRCLLRVVP